MYKLKDLLKLIVYIYIYIYIYIYLMHQQTAAVSLFESSSVQLRSKEDLEGPECSNYYQSCECCILLVATFLDQQSDIYTYVHTYTHTYIDIDIFTHAHIHIYIHTHLYAHTYKLTYTYTNIYIHTYTQLQNCL